MFSFIAFSWFLSLGLVPLQEDCVNGNKVSINTVSTVAEIGVSATMWDRLTVGGSVENYQLFSTGYYTPYRVDYKFFATFTVQKGVTLNFMHECDHPVLHRTSGKTDYNYLSNVTTMYIKLEGQTK